MKKIICVLGLLLVGCEDPINVALPAVENKLVIDAMLWRNLGETSGTLEVIISRTADYYDEEVPYVSNATVTLQQLDMIFTAKKTRPDTTTFTMLTLPKTTLLHSAYLSIQPRILQQNH